MKTLIAVIEDLLNMESFIEYNINLAGDMNFKLHFLYIQNPALYTLSTGTAAGSSQPIDNEVDVIRLETERKNALESIKKQADKLRKDLSQDISTKISAEAGTIKMIVNQYITDNKAEMIVLKGQGSVKFYEGFPHQIKEVEIADLVPEKLEEAVGFDFEEKHLQYRSAND